jgi:ABC-type transporter Mla subunit MlaD
LPPGERKAFIAPNSYISGARETGISDLAKEGGALVDDLRGAVRKIDNTLDRLNNDALSPGNMQNLKASIEHLNEATGALAQSSAKLDGVIDKADGAMGSIKKDADDLQGAIIEARKVFQSATQGKGLLPTLLSNQELANDLRALIANLRAHGVLFYRDTAAKIDMNAREQTKPVKQSGRR